VKLCRLLLIFTLELHATTASPDPSPPQTIEAQSRAHSERGLALSRDGKYREARVEFLAGFELSKRPAFLFNIAECSRLLGDIADARAHYERYLALAPDGRQAALTRERLAALPSAATSPPPMTSPSITTSPSAAGASSDASAVRPAPDLRPASLGRDPVGASITGVEPTREPRAPSSSRSRWPLWVAVGAGVVAASAIALYASTRSDGCGAGCIDWRDSQR
jgi:hypothetical protein